MKPREIEVQIEELVLHGFDPPAGWNVAEALGNELRGLLAEKGIPPAWQGNPEQIEAGAIRSTCLTTPSVVGAQIAGAIYRGGAGR